MRDSPGVPPIQPLVKPGVAIVDPLHLRREVHVHVRRHEMARVVSRARILLKLEARVRQVAGRVEREAPQISAHAVPV